MCGQVLCLPCILSATRATCGLLKREKMFLYEMTSRTSRGCEARLNLLHKMGQEPKLLRLVGLAPTSRSICLTIVVFKLPFGIRAEDHAFLLMASALQKNPHTCVHSLFERTRETR